MTRLPYPDACRVLEALFPEWKAEQLFAPYARQHRGRDAEDAGTPLAGGHHPGAVVGHEDVGQFQDVTAVYATRSEFISNVPPHTLFDDATSIRACGLSLNLICQPYAEHGLRRLVERGGSIRCLFLDPDGSAIRQREQEEYHQPGTLSELTRINIRLLQERVREHVAEDARARLEIGTYDETIRFNIILVDERVGIVQPYLPAMRGIDSPTFVLERKWEDRGLFPVFEAVVSSLWMRARML